jgi:hypothetical protein
MAPEVTIITPTKDRPIGIKLLKEWIDRQDFTGLIQWIISEDSTGNETPVSFAWENKEVNLVHLWEPSETSNPNEVGTTQSGIRSMCKNFLRALPHIEAPVVVIMEDDDYYPPQYLSDAYRRVMFGADFVGPKFLNYYNLKQMSYRRMQNRGSAMCSTSFRTEPGLSLFKEALHRGIETGNKDVDAWLWIQILQRKKHLWTLHESEMEQTAVVGIKGLPGARGIGIGHDPAPRWNFQPDPSGDVLKAWTSPQIARVYKQIREGISYEALDWN